MNYNPYGGKHHAGEKALQLLKPFIATHSQGREKEP